MSLITGPLLVFVIIFPRLIVFIQFPTGICFSHSLTDHCSLKCSKIYRGSRLERLNFCCSKWAIRGENVWQWCLSPAIETSLSKLLFLSFSMSLLIIVVVPSCSFRFYFIISVSCQVLELIILPHISITFYSNTHFWCCSNSLSRWYIMHGYNSGCMVTLPQCLYNFNLCSGNILISKLYITASNWSFFPLIICSTLTMWLC